MDRRPILLGWGAANTFGWGVAGMNIFRQWAMSQDVAPLMAYPTRDIHAHDEEPVRLRQLLTAVLNSNKFAEQLAAATGPRGVDMPVVHALGNRFDGDSPILGTRNLGRLVFEDTNIAPHLAKLRAYDAIVCASEWNAQILRAHGVPRVHVAHEAVDQSLFFPAPKAGLFSPDRFYIFTGGKIEFRKAQDLVLLAFREFSRRHDDAVLVTAWHSPWPELSEGFQGRLDASLKRAANGKIDVARWAGENGLAPKAVVDIGQIPNLMMPNLLRQMDCALQPSRAEGGTNFVAMEAMACGLPVVIARNTGMIDVVREDNCVPLTRQSATPSPDGWGTAGWGESDVEEIIAALEALYASTELRAKIGAASSAFMQSRTWATHAAALKQLAFAQD